MYQNYRNRTSPSRRISPPVLISNHIDQHDSGLTGVEGAEAIVKLLRVHESVHHLILGHNNLGDVGCIALFDHLRSEEGRKHKIVEISLNGNRIGDAGLWAIARYLEDNKSLGALFLQNNVLKGNRPVMLRFVLAVNRSNLHTLSLTCNKSLGNSISTTFLPNLSAPRLAELHLSVCSLGPPDTPAVLSYLSSPRSLGLHTLKLNGNPFGLLSVSRIINTLERNNWSISWLEMHACCLAKVQFESSAGWKECEEKLRMKVLERNRFLGKKAADDALVLLRHARPALLAYGRQAKGVQLLFPPEIVIHILSFLAPSLSNAQQIRVCTYAASPDTLPTIEITIPQYRPYFPAAVFQWPTSLTRFSPRHTCIGETPTMVCAACVRMERMMWPKRDEERKTWLRNVGCDRFEPELVRGEFDTQHPVDGSGEDNVEEITINHDMNTDGNEDTGN